MNDDLFDSEMPLEEQVARMAVSDDDTLARRVAEMRGTPFGTNHLTPDQELWSWTFEDTTINADQLRMAGMPESEINAHRYPLQSKLMEQAGRSFEEQRRYHDRMWERAYRAQSAGRTPKPPTRESGLDTPKLVLPKEL
jgi:hypothetical protein